MNYYWFNREKLLKMHAINITITEENKKLLIKKCQEKMLREKEKN